MCFVVVSVVILLHTFMKGLCEDYNLLGYDAMYSRKCGEIVKDVTFLMARTT